MCACECECGSDVCFHYTTFCVCYAERVLFFSVFFSLLLFIVWSHGILLLKRIWLLKMAYRNSNGLKLIYSFSVYIKLTRTHTHIDSALFCSVFVLFLFFSFHHICSFCENAPHSLLVILIWQINFVFHSSFFFAIIPFRSVVIHLLWLILACVRTYGYICEYLRVRPFDDDDDDEHWFYRCVFTICEWKLKILCIVYIQSQRAYVIFVAISECECECECFSLSSSLSFQIISVDAFFVNVVVAIRWIECNDWMTPLLSHIIFLYLFWLNTRLLYFFFSFSLSLLAVLPLFLSIISSNFVILRCICD